MYGASHTARPSFFRSVKVHLQQQWQLVEMACHAHARAKLQRSYRFRSHGWHDRRQCACRPSEGWHRNKWRMRTHWCLDQHWPLTIGQHVCVASRPTHLQTWFHRCFEPPYRCCWLRFFHLASWILGWFFRRRVTCSANSCLTRQCRGLWSSQLCEAFSPWRAPWRSCS